MRPSRDRDVANRNLTFSTYDELIGEIERLEGSPYRRNGRWSLGQVCRHLNYFQRGSLEGFGFKLPWLVRRFIGKPFLRKLLAGEPMPKGGRTIPKAVPAETVDEAAEIAEAKALLARLRDSGGPLHPSPFFGEMTPEEWKEVHLRHAAHHLNFLVPGEGGPSS